jgi:acyl transferase domain-containing protein/NADPH:quinone reductase-like Zn-dependent oxidoreductase/short-subunit dehydrogenase
MSELTERIEQLPPLQRAVFALKELRAQMDALERARTEPIAVVGIGCRFPGARTPDEFWQLLRDGVDAVTEVPPERWDLKAWYDPDPGVPGKMYTRWGSFLEGIDRFDPLFFGMAPREAVSLDPQQRLLLEVTWEALEDAGIAPDRLGGTPAGVFIGVGPNEYARQVGDPASIDSHVLTGNAVSVAAGRLAYVLGLQGPALAIDTACSSSLVAVHLACQSLRAGECRLALAGGVNVLLAPDSTVALSEMGALSPSGRCRTFDARADGYVRGEGCGIVVLKKLSDAQRDGDNILALIRGTAINHDGRSAGLTVPNGPAQEAVIRAALAAARVEPGQVPYVEAHGTGTPLGDPIEVRALAAVFGAGHSKERPLLIGSVKTNVGHLEAAAGIAGLIKVVLALHHGQIPPHLHFQSPNQHLPWEELSIRVPVELTPWADGPGRRAGISSFGFSGTNAHAVLEEAPSPAPLPAIPDRPCHLLTLSGRDETALREQTRRLKQHLENHPAQSLADLCFTAGTGRAHFTRRAALVAGSTTEALARLAALVEDRAEPGMTRGEVRGTPGRVAFLFTGQGSQYAGMARELYQTSPLFHQELDNCSELLQPHLDRPLLEVLYPAEGQDSPLNQTGYAQPALFALEYALCRLWQSWGVQPTAVLGHSLGEYVAACMAGVLSLEDALALVATRARLMQALPSGGAMAALLAPQAQVEAALAGFAGRLSLAALNGSNTVVSGDAEAVDQLLSKLDREGVRGQRLQVSHAFHSARMEPALAELERAASALKHASPGLRLVTNLTGQVAGAGDLGPGYWARHARQPVRFAQGVQALRDLGCEVLVEIGPQPTLLGMARRCLPEDQPVSLLPSLRRGQGDWQTLLESLAALYVRGAPLDWAAFDRDYPRRKVTLPTYPFQRQRYWLKPAARPAPVVVNARREALPFPGQRLRAAIKETIFESRFSADDLPFLADHRVHDRLVVAGACHIALILAAVREMDGSGICMLGETAFPQALVLPETGTCRVQAIFSPLEGREVSFQVFSCPEGDEGETWTLHAEGRVNPTPQPPPRSGEGESEDPTPQPPPRSGEGEQDRRGREEAALWGETATDHSGSPSPLRGGGGGGGVSFYQTVAEHGVALGPAFRWIEELWQGEGEALCRMRMPVGTEEQVAPLHPGLVDSCVQMVVAALPREGIKPGPYIPVGFEHFRFEGPVVYPLWAQARVRPVSAGTDEFTGDVSLFAEDGRIVADCQGLRFRRAPRAAFLAGPSTSTDGLLYRVRWQALEQGPATTEPGGRWLLLGDTDDLGSLLAERISRSGSDCHLSASLLGDFQHLLKGPLTDVVLLSGVGEPGDLLSAQRLAEIQRREVGALLSLVQALARRAGSSPRLWVLTRGVTTGDGPNAVTGSPLWGMARVIALEHPELNCTCIDLAPGAGAEEVDLLASTLLAGGSERQLALRDGKQQVARLEPAALESGRLSRPAGLSCRLEVGTAGVLHSLVLRPVSRRPPRDHEVEIEVRATGLNFRDVLNALGMYPGEAGPLGLECAGTVTAVGDGVRGLTVGDDVLAMAAGSFGTHVATDARLVARKPDRLSPEEAATIPVVFLTAHHGLNHLAKLQPGERVLIHAAAGGVGLAAVQLAHRVGATVLATAGSLAKREFLHTLGIEHVFDSRSLSFADDVRAATGGEGVHVVLNSLAGEFIPTSLQLLAPGGRFLEIGKTEIWSPKRVAAVRPDVAYFTIALDQMGINDPAYVGTLLQELLPAFADGGLQPLPRHVFPLEEAPAAFRFMAQARHTGKIVLSQNPETSRLFRPDGYYLVTGGLGALGLRVARWLVEHGARHLVLLGRRRPSSEAAAILEALESEGAHVLTLQANVAEEDDLGKALAGLPDDWPALRGVFHAAGVLDDGVLLEQSWGRFEKVLAPKVQGAWNLHLLSQGIGCSLPLGVFDERQAASDSLRGTLDFFVLFSSAAALLGSPGQGNYAAANAFLDALAHYRRALGLPALSINWGPWQGEGMAAALGDRERERWTERGMGMIDPEEGLALLERALRADETQLAVLPVDWSRFLKPFVGSVPPFLSGLTRETTARRAEFLEQLNEAPAGRRREMLVKFLREQAIRVLGLAPGHPLGNDQPLHELGLDSLLAVELRNVLGAALGRTLPATVLFNYPCIEALANWLMSELFAATPVEEQPTGDAGETDQARNEIESLSEDQLDELLAGFAEKHLKGAEG